MQMLPAGGKLTDYGFRSAVRLYMRPRFALRNRNFSDFPFRLFGHSIGPDSSRHCRARSACIKCVRDGFAALRLLEACDRVPDVTFRTLRHGIPGFGSMV